MRLTIVAVLAGLLMTIPGTAQNSEGQQAQGQGKGQGTTMCNGTCQRKGKGNCDGTGPKGMGQRNGQGQRGCGRR